MIRDWSSTLQAILSDPSLAVPFRSADVRLWRTGNSWGDEALQFGGTQDGRTERILPKPKVYTRNVPAFITLALGDHYEISYDIGDGNWGGRPQ